MFVVFQGSSLLNIVLGLAASLLALSILIQILQEFYKFLFKSKSAAYKKVLLDLIGSQAAFLWEAPETADFRVRGPWDVFRRKPGGILQPLAKEQLGEALSRAAPHWVTRTLEQIELERTGGATKADATTWGAFLDRLGETGKGATGFGTAKEIAGLLKDFGHSLVPGESNLGTITTAQPPDLAKLEAAVRQKFLPQVDKVEKDFDLIDRNLQYTYKRRNMRQTFTLGLLVAFVMSFPVQDLYDQAAALTDEQAVAMTEQMLTIYESQKVTNAADSVDLNKKLEELNSVLAFFTSRIADAIPDTTRTPADSLGEKESQKKSETVEIAVLTSKFWKKGFLEWLSYILGCLMTAILLSFGAPFWNDVAKSVLNFKKSIARPTAQPAAAEAKGSNT